MRRHSGGTGRRLLLVGLALVFGAGLAGCGDHEALVRRYRAERLSWNVEKLERAIAQNPDLATDAMLSDLADRHKEIVMLFPPPAGDPPPVERETARVSAASRFALASLEISSGELDDAGRWYSSIADSYAFDRDLALEALSQLARVRGAAGEWEPAVAVYRRLTEDWRPAVEDGGLPDSRILTAPVRIADGYRAQGMEEEARRAYESAREYYRRLIADAPGSPTARAALGEIAETYVRQERWVEAADTYTELDTLFGDEASRSQIWLTLADILGERLASEDLARDYYGRVESDYGDEIPGATASIAIARYDIEAGRHAEARERLERVLEEFGDEERIAATASYLLALSHELGGEWDSAAARYQSLARDFPATMYGLRAPLHVADRYERVGEVGGARSALSRAVEHYRVVIRDYTGTPAELAASAYLIDALIRLERWRDAAGELLAVVERHPSTDASPGMLVQAGMIYELELDEANRARALYQRVIDEYPESNRAADACGRLEALPERESDGAS